MASIHNLLFYFLFLSGFHYALCCIIDSAPNWLLPVSVNILDVDRGVIFRNSTTSILGVNTITYSEDLEQDGYISASLEGEDFIISTNENFALYEEYETSAEMSVTINFECDGGGNRDYYFRISIQDTNNNAPQFLPENNYQFTIATPVPPGFLITACGNEITVRDIDLTTESITFSIEENPYFEIEYNAEASIEPKLFQGIIKTKSLIRTIPEAITLQISATDVDRTGDDPITSLGTIRVEANGEFQLPEDPIFSQPFYLADYMENELVLPEIITLRQGYDEQVIFSLDYSQANSEFFNVTTNGNQVAIIVQTPLPTLLLHETEIFLVVNAEREDTSGATATVIARLPEVIPLEFQQLTYEGQIIERTLQLPALILVQGYTDDEELIVTITGTHSSYFDSTAEGNSIQLTMSPIIEEILDEVNVINLHIKASDDYSEASSVVVIEVVKMDALTPAFDKYLYSGHYTVDGFSHEDIIIEQGFDDTVTVNLTGSNSNYFAINNTGNAITITLVTDIPLETIYEEKALVFNILAEKSGIVEANAAIAITFSEELTTQEVMRFSKISYIGTLDNDDLSMEEIILTSGYADDTEFHLDGEYSTYFSTTNTNNNNIVSIVISDLIPIEVLEDNSFILLEIEARRNGIVTVPSAIIIEIVKLNEAMPVFEKTVYTGQLDKDGELVFEENIALASGYDDSVVFYLDGEFSEMFSLKMEDNLMSIEINGTVSDDLIANNIRLVFDVVANKPSTTAGRAAVLIEIIKEPSATTMIQFSQTSYVGRIENGILDIQPLNLDENYGSLNITASGDYASFFDFSLEENTVHVILNEELPSQVINDNNFIILDVVATEENMISGFAAIVLEIQKDSDQDANVLLFNKAYYEGDYSFQRGLVFEENIQLIRGFNEETNVTLHGDHAEWFSLHEDGTNDLKLILSADELQIEAMSHLVLSVIATRPDFTNAESAIVISITDYVSDDSLRFEQDYYYGKLLDQQLAIDPIQLNYYPDDLVFDFKGDFENYFQLTDANGIFTLEYTTPLPDDFAENLLIFSLEAYSENKRAHTSLIIEIERDNIDANEDLSFENVYYLGTYSVTSGLELESQIALSNGFDASVTYEFEGDDSDWFEYAVSDDSVTLVTPSPIPDEVLNSKHQFVFVFVANKPDVTARTTIIISIVHANTSVEAAFNKALYQGILQSGTLYHEDITVVGYSGTDIRITGEYSQFFNAQMNDEATVTIQTSEQLILPSELTYVALTMEVEESGAALVIDVVDTDSPVPNVTFDSSLYQIEVDSTKTGVVGQVSASADNGEAVKYSILIEHDHLRERLMITNEGELVLTAPVNLGDYTATATATTDYSKVSADARVQIIVTAVGVCDDNTIFLPPLIILDRDEEEPHQNLVLLNETHVGCHFEITNKWPEDQTWLYVDEIGLHTTAIDREDQSIAFMALSQVQVELDLICDVTKRSKREIDLGPYDYGTKKWTLTESIPFNPRKSLVNLVVNDINDNAPVFLEKENEPLILGYLVPGLLETVVPRALAELQATDADIGENAALVYWSSSSVLSVAPLTGSVHVRDGMELENDMMLTVHATDRNGLGLTGSINVIVKLLESRHVAVVTVRDSFADDEITIMSNLTTSLGYQVKALRTDVISADVSDQNLSLFNGQEPQSKRMTSSISHKDDKNEKDTNILSKASDGFEKVSRNETEISASGLGASIQIYLYGLIEGEPVEVERLTNDIVGVLATVNVVSVVSLEDHLTDGCKMGRDIGLLAATIVTSTLLFMMIVAILGWFFLKRRKQLSYNEFNNEESRSSSSVSLDSIPKSEPIQKPRIDIEELKKSEKRLQAILDAPIIEKVVVETKINAEPKPQIVIQSIDKLKDNSDDSDNDDDDEFGERRRKSVVKFNENVEKFIHLEDNSERSQSPDIEVYQF